MALRRDPPPRRRGPELYRRPLGRLRLNIGDVDDVLTLLRARTKEVVLRAGRAVADEAVDLREARSDELGNITIVTAEPAISVRLGGVAEVSTSEASDDVAKVLVDDVHSLLSERRHFWAGSSPLWAFSGIGFFGFAATIILDLLFPDEDEPVPIMLGFLAFSIAFGMVAWRDHVKNGIAIVEPARMSEQRSRLQGIWVVAVSVAASAVITFFLTYWQIAAK
ncbi:hypothetical protein ACIBVK_06660 [Micromonospora echinofusca]|uniref:hypothetical protein n=1 Tax=Micromonospora echinofusca TaxID=47858 RepID=UPI0037AEE3A1